MNRPSYATVMARGRETRYLRTGTGPTVVLLVPRAPHTDPGFQTLLAAVAERFKVIAPELPECVAGAQPDMVAATCWMSGVLDGLGVTETFLVVDSRLHWLAAALRAEDAERIRGTAILVDGHPESMHSAVTDLSRRLEA